MQYASRTREPLRFACGDRCESIDSLVGETRTEPGQCSVSSEEIGILGQRDWQGGGGREEALLWVCGIKQQRASFSSPHPPPVLK